MANKLVTFLKQETQNLEQAGLLKTEFVMNSPQDSVISTSKKKLINLASGNYLGLSNNIGVKDAAKNAIEEFGFGLSSTRVILGTVTLHKQLEELVSNWLGTESTLLYSSRYHANAGFFESLFNEQDFVFCDSLIHPSLAEGVRLCRAKKFSYENNDVSDLEDKLKRSKNARFRAVVTDGVFPLDGTTARLNEISDLAKKYDALLVVDDSEGLGVLGKSGVGSKSTLGEEGKIDIITGSFGNALGGGMGGFTSGKKEIVEWLRQKSRSYLFSDSLPPGVVAGALESIKRVKADETGRNQLRKNVVHFRSALMSSGFRLIASEHPNVAIIVRDAVVAQRMADRLFQKGVYVMGYCYPVVPKGLGSNSGTNIITTLKRET